MIQTSGSPERPRLRPFQADAVAEFFADGAPPRLALSAPRGTGKGATASAVAAEALRRGAAAIAVLAPTGFTAQGIAWRAAREGVTPFELHRAVASSASSRLEPTWPGRVLTFGPLRLARREPVAAALRARTWDLVVVDVSGAEDDDLRALLQLLSQAAVTRLLILDDSASPSVDLRRLQAVPLSYPGQQLETGPPAQFQLSVVTYERSLEEVALMNRAQQATIELRRLGVRVPARLPAAVRSSPLAAESRAFAAAREVRRVRNRLAHGLSGEGTPASSHVDVTAIPDLERLGGEFEAIGNDVDLLEHDPKWEAFMQSFRERDPADAVVFCDFDETARYVSSRLQDNGADVIQLQDVADVRELEAERDAVLVAQDELLLGVELRQAVVAYNYDLPPSPRRGFIRWSRLDWSRTDPPVQMVVILDRRSSAPTERISFARFRALVEGSAATMSVGQEQPAGGAGSRPVGD